MCFLVVLSLMLFRLSYVFVDVFYIYMCMKAMKVKSKLNESNCMKYTGVEFCDCDNSSTI